MLMASVETNSDSLDVTQVINQQIITKIKYLRRFNDAISNHRDREIKIFLQVFSKINQRFNRIP